jgi:hypothetical protein
MKGENKKEDPYPSQMDNTTVGMVYGLHLDINSGIILPWYVKIEYLNSYTSY